MLFFVGFRRIRFSLSSFRFAFSLDMLAEFDEPRLLDTASHFISALHASADDEDCCFSADDYFLFEASFHGFLHHGLAFSSFLLQDCRMSFIFISRRYFHSPRDTRCHAAAVYSLRRIFFAICRLSDCRQRQPAAIRRFR